MKKLFNIIFLIGICSVLLTCKKYDEGGLISRTNKHLFGGNKVGDSKTWKLKKYEVNGIDSTYLINTGGIPDFYEKFITFKFYKKGDPSATYLASNLVYEYIGKVSPGDRYLTIDKSVLPYNIEDSTQCKLLNNITYCVRNTLFPELTNSYTKIWYINKLTRNQLILNTNFRMQNTYKIELEF